MRIVPLSSSISTSAWTLGPCFLASAAWIPSYRRPCSSVRSSCFEFVSSLIADKISSEPAILCSLPSPDECQPRLFHGRQRDAQRPSAAILCNNDFLSFITFDTGDPDLSRARIRTAFNGLASHNCFATHEPAPV